eukprot:TRINITY_DN9258_c0_g1_i8.p2 TRINITY_DN9258_c0_g1~~TRINITY_DN9258_c0_g1_i8.p2  ORF type:complete len:117 (+),score=12.48 TRINITY_DN9258_c0_g1_i8:283-633(+)
MQETDRTRVEIPTAALHVIPSKPVLVPPVLDGRHVSSEDQKERWERSELVNPIALLDLHPPLDPFSESEPPPLHQIDQHHSGVEVARPPAGKRAGKPVIGPKPPREVLGEVRVAVF